MNRHHHDVHQNPSTSTLSSPSSSSNSNNNSTKAKLLLSKINKLVRPSENNNNGIFGLRSPRSTTTTTPTSGSTVTDLFRVVHEPDRMPLYSPPMPMNPRTERECEEALKEMFAQARVGKMAERQGSSQEEQARTMSLTIPDSRYDEFVGRQESRSDPPQDRGGASMSKNHRRLPFIVVPQDGMATSSHSEQPSVQTPPVYRRPEVVRLESIPGSPMTPVTAVFTPTMTTTPLAVGLSQRPMTPSTPRSTDSRGVQSVISGESARAPRLLSQRALIALDPKDRGKQGTNMHSTLSPLSWSPVSMEAPTSRPPGWKNTAVAEELLKTPPRPRQDDADAWATKTRSSVTADDWASTDSDDDVAGTSTLLLREIGQAHKTKSVENTTAQAPRTPPNKRCLMCPEPCRPNARLCDKCREEYEQRDSDMEDSDSAYEDIVVRTPSLSPPTISPRKAKRFAMNNNTPTRLSPHDPVMSFPRTISWLKAPPFPRDSSTPQTPVQGPYRFSSRSLSISPTPYIAQQLEVFPSPPLRRVSISSPASQVEASESALYHLGRRMLSDGGNEVIRVGRVRSGEGQMVLCPNDDDDENGDTMKMLADEGEGSEKRAGWRKHEAGGSYGDWFSYYAEKEGKGVASLEQRTSMGSSVYDRIVSIYDLYAELSEEYDHVDMF
ncbi:hypothetical protein M406DRAFT_67250 [Cryphonectria parasitica EP155]|uniref:Uncharacterized protein n=1 Tax=Cryphonectria parasitica (strain ATCC 38755 / EP155) TaxID=660469 RepID=A0A9P4YD44_CRYP1|nr:uncharacterized protein M406DRAFT_67250 [Cryphonectria parasitica EP155]KAF3770888.1 hypothetical protein M406DRAFT_67250 [Cryphonectria parasitica EP155]